MDEGAQVAAIVQGALEICVVPTTAAVVVATRSPGRRQIFIQLLDNFFKSVCPAECGFEVPDEGDYGVGFVFLSKDDEERANEEQIIAEIAREEGFSMLGWRDVPVRSEILGKASAACEPVMRQFFVARGDVCARGLEFERKLYLCVASRHTASVTVVRTRSPCSTSSLRAAP